MARCCRPSWTEVVMEDIEKMESWQSFDSLGYLACALVGRRGVRPSTGTLTHSDSPGLPSCHSSSAWGVMVDGFFSRKPFSLHTYVVSHL